MLIDTHAHLNFSAYKDDADEVIQKTLAKGIFVVNVGSQYSTSVRAVEYARKHEKGVYAAVGIHPIHLEKRYVEYHDPNELEASQEIKANGEDLSIEKYEELAKDPKVVAIGEVGLDYHHFEEGDDTEKMKSKQKEVFIEFIKLANKLKKPLMIHCWDAYSDLLEILSQYDIQKKGVIHSFVGGYKTAKKFTDLGYKLGLNGVVTYSDSFHRLIKEVSLEDVVLETDCPYLTPMPKKGERNEPLYVEYVAEKIAEIKDISFDKIAEVTTSNAKELFSL